jgi:hypothetical protein
MPEQALNRGSRDDARLDRDQVPSEGDSAGGTEQVQNGKQETAPETAPLAYPDHIA